MNHAQIIEENRDIIDFIQDHRKQFDLLSKLVNEVNSSEDLNSLPMWHFHWLHISMWMLMGEDGLQGLKDRQAACPGLKLEKCIQICELPEIQARPDYDAILEAH